MAPEITELIDQIKNKKQDGKKVVLNYDPEKTDVFALGIVLGSLCCLEPFDARDTLEQQDSKLEKIQSLYPKMHSLVLDMIAKDPAKRRQVMDLAGSLLPFKAELQKVQFFELEFESGLASTGDKGSNEGGGFEKKFADMVRQGDFNMRNNFFGEAIMSYLKVYEMIKRGEIPFKKE